MASTNLVFVFMTFLVAGIHEQGHGVSGAIVNVIVGPLLEYYPKYLEINVGDTVSWKWAYPDVPGVVPHTVTRSLTFEDKCEYIDDLEKAGRGVDFHTGFQVSGFEYSVTFTKPELITYHCETTGITGANCLLGMWGQINVVPSGARTEIIDLSKYKLSPGIATDVVMSTPMVKNFVTGVGQELLSNWG